MYNRQLHLDEIKWIKSQAEAFAKQEGITVEEAQRRLITEAAAQVDAVIAERVGINAVDSQALEFLNSNDIKYTWGNAFKAVDTEYGDFDINGNFLDKNPDEFRVLYNSLAASGIRDQSLKVLYTDQLLAYANTQVAETGRDITTLIAASALAGAGGAVAIEAGFLPGAISAWKAMPWWAVSAASDAGSSTAIYLGTAVVRSDDEGDANSTSWSEELSNRVLLSGILIAAGIGAVFGMYGRGMLRAAELPETFLGSWNSLGGVVIRGNQMAAKAATQRATSAAADAENKKSEEKDK